MDMERLKEYLGTLFLAVLGGCAISIGGCVLLSIDNKVIGALMFTIGLYSICLHELNLYTGKIGYLANQPVSYCVDLLIMWIGNLVGTILSAFAVKNTRIASISKRAAQMCVTKLNDSLLSLFLLGVFCGILMFVAVEGFRISRNPIILFMGVGTFIISGFEHCVADMFYVSVAGAWSGKALLIILVISLGNSVGSLLIPLAKKMPRKEIKIT